MNIKVKKAMSIGLTVLAAVSLSNISTVKASGCNYSHSVKCNCCNDTAYVTERFEFYDSSKAMSYINVYEGSINESQQALYINGRSGKKYGSDVNVDVLYRYNISGKSSSYYWHNEYDFYGEKARMTFDIRKGTNWDRTNGFWQNT